MPGAAPLLVAGRYALFDPIARGGMATVHLGRLLGAAGFARIVAIKRLLPTHAGDAELAAAFLDEARLAARVRHAHVASTIDVVEEGGEIFLVSEYVHGASIAALMKVLGDLGERFPPELAARACAGAMRGLHAVHEARAEDGSPLAIVHRDVSPQNVLVGVDGVPKVIDFGIAKANVRSTSTREGQLKGKLAYMPPEQLGGGDVTRASDIYAAGVVLWEMLAGRRMFRAPTEAGIVGAILEGRIPRLAAEAPWVRPALAYVVERALARDPAKRWPTALEMAVALEVEAGAASAEDLGAWVARVAAEPLADHAARVARIERGEAAGLPDAFGATGSSASSSSRRAGSRDAGPVLGPSPDDSVVRTATAVDVKPKARPRAVMAVALVVGLIGAGAVALRFRPHGEPSAAPPTGAPSVPPPGPAAPETEAQREAVADPSTSPAPTPSLALPSAPGAPPPVSATAPPAPPGRPGPARARAPSPAASTPSTAPPGSSPPAVLPDCDPPVYVDAAGIRRVKRHCIGR